MASDCEITGLLAAIRYGDAGAESRLVGLVYKDLRAIAQRHMRRERLDHTLQPTALVNETYLRLTASRSMDWKDRAHFFATASAVMRRVLVDHARRRGAGKRAEARQKIELEDFMATTSPQIDQLILLDQALTKLSEWGPRQARLVEMIYFGGLTEKEAAEVLQISVRTVKRDWSAARAWLQSQFSSPPK